MNALEGPRVAVVGGATCSAQEERAAEEIGRQLALAGAVVLTGGRGGVMEAASIPSRNTTPIVTKKRSHPTQGFIPV